MVLKLFNLVQPNKAYFGEKDAQQLAVIRRMVQDLNVPVSVIPVPTVREPDGLALSSRNKHLTAAERQIAPVLWRALQHAVHLMTDGERSVPQYRMPCCRFSRNTPKFSSSTSRSPTQTR